jgi:hypothetical protein
MKSLIVAFFILPLISISAHAQTGGQQPTCKLTEANAPNIRGIRLGMSTRDLLALFPGSADRQEIKDALKEAGAVAGSETVRLTLVPATYSSGERFARIDAVSASLEKGRLVGFGVTYIGPGSNGPSWRNVDEWIAKLAEAFNLPSSQAWATSSEENRSKVLRCSGFEIEATAAGGTGALSVRSNADSRAEEERMSAEQEKKRREFKP